jgi:hypothetical protein
MDELGASLPRVFINPAGGQFFVVTSFMFLHIFEE